MTPPETDRLADDHRRRIVEIEAARLDIRDVHRQLVARRWMDLWDAAEALIADGPPLTELLCCSYCEADDTPAMEHAPGCLWDRLRRAWLRIGTTYGPH